jgi:hypothetical protein
MDWYDEFIEEPIRDIVKLLRDNGFNTTSSCGHAMVVEMELYSDNSITRLFNLLQENDHNDFMIETYWSCRKDSWNRRSMLVKFNPFQKEE